jgi:hypothetical protein
MCPSKTIGLIIYSPAILFSLLILLCLLALLWVLLLPWRIYETLTRPRP